MLSLKEIIKYIKENDINEAIDNLLYKYNCYFINVELAIHLMSSENKDIIQQTLSQKRDDYNFRKSVRTYYNDECIISHHSFEECSICHIKPFSISSQDEKYNPLNGIILNNSLHSLFDKFLFTIHPTNNNIILSNKIISKNTSITKYKDEYVDINPESYDFLIWHYDKFTSLNQ
jgi:predicted restriction endonuclease